MDSKELVSVIIGVYNNWPDLELTIHSALQQSHGEVEVIVVDNGSSDCASQEAPARFGNRIHYIRQGNVGDAGAYNTGIRHSHGEFLVFIDGDDVLFPNMIEKNMVALREDPEADIVYGPVRLFQSEPGVPNWVDADGGEFSDLLHALIDPAFTAGTLVTQNMVFRRRVFDRVGLWDEALPYVVDSDFWFRAAWAGCRFRYCRESLGLYRVRKGSVSHNVPLMTEGFEKVLAKALGYIDREPYRSALANRLARFRFGVALSGPCMTLEESLAKLSLARSTCPDAISPLAYWIASFLLRMPGGRTLTTSTQLKWLRRGVADAIGFL